MEKIEKKSLAISFLHANRKEFSVETFKRIGNWFNYGVNNWATTDVMCMLILSNMLNDHIIVFKKNK